LILRRAWGNARRRFQFQKRSQLFIRAHNETLSVVAMCVDNPDRAAVATLETHEHRSDFMEW
jgi:hypothetical protein